MSSCATRWRPARWWRCSRARSATRWSCAARASPGTRWRIWASRGPRGPCCSASRRSGAWSPSRPSAARRWAPWASRAASGTWRSASSSPWPSASACCSSGSSPPAPTRPRRCCSATCWASDPATLWTLLAITLATLAALAALARPLLFASLQPELAEARGVPVRRIGVLFLALTGLAVAGCVQVVGVLLVFALLVAPAAAARALTPRLLPGAALATALALTPDLVRPRPRLAHRLARQLLDRAAQRRHLRPGPRCSRSLRERAGVRDSTKHGSQRPIPLEPRPVPLYDCRRSTHPPRESTATAVAEGATGPRKRSGKRTAGRIRTSGKPDPQGPAPTE